MILQQKVPEMNVSRLMPRKTKKRLILINEANEQNELIEHKKI